MRTKNPGWAFGLTVLSISFAWMVAACAAPPTAPTGSVEGLVTEGGLLGVSGVVVRVQGQTTLTDADGRFTLEGISVPYDVSLSQTSGDGWLHVIEGLTDRAPVIDPIASSSVAATPSTVDVSGALSGGGVWPLPAGRRMLVCVEGRELLVFGCDDVVAGESAYDFTANLLYATSADVRLHALRIVVDVDGRPTGYEGYGFVDVALVAGVPSVVPLDLAAVPVDDLEVAFDVPGGAALGDVLVTLRLGDRGSLLLFDGAPAGDAFTLPVPVLPGARYAIFAGATSAGGTAVRWSVVDGLEAGTLAFPVPAQLTSPLAGATGVTAATAFEAVVAGSGPRTFRWTSGAGPELALTTTRSAVTLPDPLAAGLAWPAGTAYAWNVVAHDGATVDAAVATLDPQIVTFAIFAGLDLPDTGSFATSEDRSFTLAP